MPRPKIARKKRRYARPSTRGLGPDGGGWSIQQASRWSGIGEHRLRAMAERNEIPRLKDRTARVDSEASVYDVVQWPRQSAAGGIRRVDQW